MRAESKGATMRRILMSVMAIVLVACSGAAPGGSTGASDAPTVAPASADAGVSSEPSSAPAPAAEASPTGGGGAGALPAECAEGFAAYLTAIEPIVAGFDPAQATLRSLEDLGQLVHMKDIELLDANGSRATYDCSAIGIEWAYFDATSPWATVLGFAGQAAPGTVAYLTAVRDEQMIDVAEVTDYGVDGCDAAVAAIKEQVAAHGDTTAGELPLTDGLPILGLYKAYLRDVGEGLCPRDALGNDEFDFFLGVG